jgi:O-antigen ligase
VLAGVTVQAALTIEHFSRLAPSELGNVDALTEHPAVVSRMLMIVMLVSLTLFAPRTGWLRLATLCAAVPTTFVFVTAERRSGIAALAAGGLLVAVSLLWHRRRLFFLVVPALSLVLVAYVAAFWNAHGPAAFPAQAVKTVVAPNAASADNLNSDVYRILETYNLVYTIRALPLQGLGFGQLFFRPLPLPDISVFELNGYISHNAILWIWVKTGIGGFAAMFYIFAKSLLHAAERIRTTPLGIDLVMSVAAASFVVMFAVYSYVDVSWDPRNCIFLGLALAMCVRPFPRARPGSDVAPVLRDAHVPPTRSERTPAVPR